MASYRVKKGFFFTSKFRLRSHSVVFPEAEKLRILI